MLPDFPKVKSASADLLKRFLVNRIQSHLGPFADVPVSTLHEGRGTVLVREDGDRADLDLRKVSSEIVIDNDRLPTFGLDQAIAELERVASEMAAQQLQRLSTVVGEAADAAGNVVEGKGRPFGPELVFEMLKTVHIEFREDGLPRLPTGWPYPDRIREAYRQIQDDPVLRGRFDQIIDEKREEWRDREARRVLVG